METYYIYLRCCRDYNERNLIDPTSDKMEWNHTLPQCIFGDIRIGLWLTLKQHAIATALQTLAFNRNCLCPWHVKYLPSQLWNLCLPLFRDQKSKVGQRHIETGHIQNLHTHRDPEKLKETARKMGKIYGQRAKESGQWDSIKPLGAAAQHAQRWINVAPGYPQYESTPCGLTKWQKSRGINHKDPNNRRRIT